MIVARARIELEYLKALAARIGNPLSEEENDRIRKILHALASSDSEIKTVRAIDERIRHDTKAIEYYLREKFSAAGLSERIPLLHFGLTSTDIDNCALAVNFRDFLSAVFVPKLTALRDALAERAALWKELPMLGRTHGRPAVPTTLGKEIANVAVRLHEAIEALGRVRLTGKLNGAVGNLNAHVAAFPDIDWIAFAKAFVASLGLEPAAITTQIPPYDRLVSVLDRIRLTNSIISAFAADVWQYASMRYFTLATVAEHVGSSTMPQKVNPIDFEMAESVCASSNAMLENLARRLPINRLQRDLTDKYLLRDLGPAMAYAYLGIDAILRGIEKLAPDEAAMHRDLDSHWEILGEAVQTILRAGGYERAYEIVKEKILGRVMSKDDFRQFIAELDVPEEIKNRLRQLHPRAYLGDAVTLTELALAEIGRGATRLNRLPQS